MNMNRLFLCYSRVDRTITERLAALLRKAFDHVWYDDNLHGGEEWWAEIRHEIMACHYFLFLMSEDSIASDWCRRELDEAFRLNKTVLPVLVRARTNVPDRLSRLQHIDMGEGIHVEGLNQLYAALIRHAPETDSQRHSDRRILDRLWLFINGHYIELLSEQVNQGKIDWEQYTAHINKYLDLRSKSHEPLHDRGLADAFENFDDALIKMDGQIGWTYAMTEHNGHPYMIRPEDASNDSYWYERYQRLNRQMTDVWMKHAALAESICRLMPDFDVMREE